MSQTVEVFRENGWARLSTGVDALGDIEQLEQSLDEFGTLFRVFLRHPMWKPLGVDVSRPVGRSGGVGVNSLHIDCVNMEDPPPIVALHCLRKDPAGGGVSTLAPTSALLGLPKSVQHLLRQSAFDEGQAFDLQNVGDCLTQFSVLPTTPGGWVRWTGRLLERSYEPGTADALRAAETVLVDETVQVALEPGETLIVEQRRFLHGRTALGEQADVPLEHRRLLVQCYVDPMRERHE